MMLYFFADAKAIDDSVIDRAMRKVLATTYRSDKKSGSMPLNYGCNIVDVSSSRATIKDNAHKQLKIIDTDRAGLICK